MTVEFAGEVWYWRGPSPFYFLRIPEAQSAMIKSVSAQITYGWGVIPVTARIGETEWTTSLIPKEGRYLLPLKDKIRKAEGLEEGQVVTAVMEV